jgi:hypothetical protein
MTERRTHSRQLTCMAASLESRWSSQDLALIRDASATGARLYTHVNLDPGEEVGVNLYLDPDSDTPLPVQARVVRIDACDPARQDVWAWEVAVEFVTPLTGYERQLEELCRRQEAAGTLKR